MIKSHAFRRALLFLILLLPCASSPAQEIPQKSVALTPANAWIKEPTSVTDPDPVRPSLRVERDQYFDSFSLSRVPLTAESAPRSHLSEGSTWGVPPEIPNDRNRAIIIGKFTSARSVFTASHWSVYTELVIRVSKVLESNAAGIGEGQNINICEFGGTIKTPNGQIISYLTDPKQYSLQPGHSYLLVLGYKQSGEFFLHLKDWLFDQGVVTPNSRIEEISKERGTSVLIGLTAAQLPAAIKQ